MANEWFGAGDLVAMTIREVTAPVEGIHDAIAGTWFRSAGAHGGDAHVLYRTMTGAVYAGVRAGATLVGLGIGVAGTMRDRRRENSGDVHAPDLLDPAGATAARAAVSALWGDQLPADGTDVVIVEKPCSPTSRLVVLLHGLGLTERSWLASSDDDTPSMFDVLVDAGFTPVLVQYNTGRSVAETAAALTEQLDELIGRWPTEVDEVSFVGYSMGGLVAVEVVGRASAAGPGPWADRIGRLITLGTPHFGSPIEKGAEWAARALDLSPVTRPLGEFVGGRSAGIRDLHERAVPSGFAPVAVPQHFLAAAVASTSSNWFGRGLNHAVGDLVVRTNSALGRSRDVDLEPDDVRVVGRLTHLGLLRDRAVHDQVVAWLTQ